MSQPGNTEIADASTEHAVWAGTPSQVLNTGAFILCFLCAGLAAPVVLVAAQFVAGPALLLVTLFVAGCPGAVALWKWVSVRNTRYTLSTQRLSLHSGVLSKESSSLELYRVKDFTVSQPLFLRLFSVSNIILETSDKSHPTFTIRAVPNGDALAGTIRKHVEIMRRGRVREVDVA